MAPHIKAENGVVKAEHDGQNSGKEAYLPRDHAALKAPEGYLGLFKTLQEYLLRLEYHLWGLLDRGWASALPFPSARVMFDPICS